MKITVQDAGNVTFNYLLANTSHRVCVKLRKACEDCSKDISVTALQMKSKTFPDTSHVETYRSGVCQNCSWERAHADGKDHFMDSKDSILNGLTESQYQTRFGQAWNE